jgi:class 3 adenylate cyclase
VRFADGARLWHKKTDYAGGASPFSDCLSMRQVGRRNAVKYIMKLLDLGCRIGVHLGDVILKAMSYMARGSISLHV